MIRVFALFAYRILLHCLNQVSECLVLAFLVGLILCLAYHHLNHSLNHIDSWSFIAMDSTTLRPFAHQSDSVVLFSLPQEGTTKQVREINQF